MSTEVATRGESTPLVYAQPTAIESWAADLTLAYQAAQKLVRTSFVPQSFKNKPEEAAAAIMTGAEVGLSPMASLRSVVIIQGTPAFTAVALRGLVQSHGHRMWVVESTSSRAIVEGVSAGSDEVQRSIWTMDRAKALGLAGKENYRKQPGAMLVARATSECARWIGADVLLGLPYSAEELEDGLAEVGVDAPVKASKRTVKRQPLPPAAEPELPTETPAQPVAEADVEQPAPPDEPDLELDYEEQSAAEFRAWQDSQAAQDRGGETP